MSSPAAVLFVRKSRNPSDDITAEFFQLSLEAQSSRELENKAAVIIQKTLRGYVARRWIKHLNSLATMVQSRYRSYRGRCQYLVLVAEVTYNVRMDYYYSHASLIQKTWRGYWSRKRVFDFQKRRKYVQDITEKMSNIRAQLKEFEVRQTDLEAKAKAALEIQRKQRLAGKVHHLKGTVAVPGVLSPTIRVQDAKSRQVKLQESARSKRIRRSSTSANGQFSLSERDLTNNQAYKDWLKANIDGNAKKMGQLSPHLRQSKPGDKPAQGPFLPVNWLREKQSASRPQTLRVTTDFYDTGRYRREERIRARNACVSDKPMSIPRVVKFEPPPPSIQKNEVFTIGMFSKAASFRKLDQGPVDRPPFRNILPPISHMD
ncbi:MAG: hypothetical protein SGCHY_003717 [Lobulomycetales sp.]